MNESEPSPPGRVEPGAPEQSLRLGDGDVVTIGSAPDTTLGAGHPQLAPYHARVERADGRLRIVDLGGGDVLVNNLPIVESAWLAPGDAVRVGRLRLTIDADGLRYRGPAANLLIQQRRARTLPDALINNMAGYSGVPIEPARPLPNPADVSRPAMFAVLRRRNFLLLWLAQLVSETGTAFTMLAASVLVYRVTGSALNVGLLMIATAAPSLLVGLIAGVFVDRWDRRRTMIGADLLRVALIAAIPFAINFSIVWLYVIVMLSNAIGQFFNPAHASLLPETAPDDELAAANALMAVSAFGSQSLGLARGGLITAYVSIGWAFYLDALTFVISAGCIFLLRTAPFVAASQATVAAVARELRDGVRFLTGVAALRSLFLMYVPIFILFGFMNTVLLPFTVQVLHGSEFEYGILQGMEGIGLVVGSLLMARLASRLHEGQWLALSFIGMGVFGIFFSQAVYVPFAVAMMLLSGAFNAPSVVARQLLIQRHTPREVRGRVNSAFFVSRDTVFMLGMAGAGLADLFAARPLMLANALLILVCGALVMALPGLRQPLTEWRRIFAAGAPVPQPSQEGN